MSVAVLVVTDGRLDYLRQTVESLEDNLVGHISERWMYDDTGNDDHRADLQRLFPSFEHFHAGPRQGFGGAIRAAWARLGAESDARYVAHCEQDFLFNRPVPLDAMALVLDHHPDLVQLALRRQPWNPEERAAGGIVEQHPDDYTEREWRGHRWLAHRRFFTTNPCLYRTDLIHQQAWPDVQHSEGHFTHQLLTDPLTTFGFWGARDSGEWVEHIGHERVGVGY